MNKKPTAATIKKQYLLTPNSLLPLFTDKRDSKYFSRPVEVQPLRSDVATRLLIVRDPARGVEFPMDPKHLRTWFGLTNKQKAALGA